MWSGGGGGGLFTSGGGKGLGQAATATAHTAKKRHRTAQNVTGTPGQCYPFALMRRALLPLCLLLAVPALAQTDDDLLAPLTPKKKTPPAAVKVKPKTKPKTGAKTPPAGGDEIAPLVPSTPVTPVAPATPAAPAKGELNIKLAAVNKRARLTIDDGEELTQPWSSKVLPAGEHTVTVRAMGFAPWTRKLTVSPNRLTEVSATLEATAAIVQVTSDVSGAEVVLNGKPAGQAPVELEVPPGTLDVLVRKEGFREAAQSLKVVAGREYPLSVKLQAAAAPTTIVAQPTDRPVVDTELTPSNTSDALTATETVEASEPIYTKWYFWVGAAAVAAAAAAGTYGVVRATRYDPAAQACEGGRPDCLSACVGDIDCSGHLRKTTGALSSAGAGILHF